jgi:hypothetical protein
VFAYAFAAPAISPLWFFGSGGVDDGRGGATALTTSIGRAGTMACSSVLQADVTRLEILWAVDDGAVFGVEVDAISAGAGFPKVAALEDAFG